jgi:hypothetical protein
MEHQTIALNVLGYQEEQGTWVALALEMDLRGYGDTFDEAFEDLTDLVSMQISFSRFKGQPDMIWKPADPIWFERFAETRRDYMEAILRESPTLSNPEYNIAGLPIPPAHVIDALTNGFVMTEA